MLDETAIVLSVNVAEFEPAENAGREAIPTLSELDETDTLNPSGGGPDNRIVAVIVALLPPKEY